MSVYSYSSTYCLCGLPNAGKGKTARRQHEGSLRHLARRSPGGLVEARALVWRLALGLPVTFSDLTFYEFSYDGERRRNRKDYNPYDTSSATLGFSSDKLTPWERVMLDGDLDMAWLGASAAELSDPETRAELSDLAELDPTVGLRSHPPIGVPLGVAISIRQETSTDPARRLVYLRLTKDRKSEVFHEVVYEAEKTLRGYARGKLPTPADFLVSALQGDVMQDAVRGAVSRAFCTIGKDRRVADWNKWGAAFLEQLRTPPSIEHYEKAGLPPSVLAWFEQERIPHDTRQVLTRYASRTPPAWSGSQFKSVAEALFPDPKV